MKRAVIVATAVLAGLCAGACNKSASGAQGAGRHGRYVGIGIYSPGEPWTRMAAANAAAQTAAARTVDDQAVIVVVDSDTGEIRGCGDLSGYCIGMNPWTKALAASQMTPVTLTEHVQPPQPTTAH